MTLLRVSHLHQGSIDGVLQDEVLERFDRIVGACDLLVFSDFNYGCLPQPLVDELSRRARSAGLLIVADSQSSSQVGDVSRFRGVDLLTPTEHEARVSGSGQGLRLGTSCSSWERKVHYFILVSTAESRGRTASHHSTRTRRTWRAPATRS